nr:hypothetical protein Iba_chr08fCG1430 [Ipomoea batatas]
MPRVVIYSPSYSDSTEAEESCEFEAYSPPADESSTVFEGFVHQLFADRSRFPSHLPASPGPDSPSLSPLARGPVEFEDVEFFPSQLSILKESDVSFVRLILGPSAEVILDTSLPVFDPPSGGYIALSLLAVKYGFWVPPSPLFNEERFVFVRPFGGAFDFPTSWPTYYFKLDRPPAPTGVLAQQVQAFRDLGPVQVIACIELEALENAGLLPTGAADTGASGSGVPFFDAEWFRRLTRSHTARSAAPPPPSTEGPGDKGKKPVDEPSAPSAFSSSPPCALADSGALRKRAKAKPAGEEPSGSLPQPLTLTVTGWTDSSIYSPNSFRFVATFLSLLFEHSAGPFLFSHSFFMLPPVGSRSPGSIPNRSDRASGSGSHFLTRQVPPLLLVLLVPYRLGWLLDMTCCRSVSPSHTIAYCPFAAPPPPSTEGPGDKGARKPVDEPSAPPGFFYSCRVPWPIQEAFTKAAKAKPAGIWLVTATLGSLLPDDGSFDAIAAFGNRKCSRERSQELEELDARFKIHCAYQEQVEASHRILTTQAELRRACREAEEDVAWLRRLVCFSGGAQYGGQDALEDYYEGSQLLPILRSCRLIWGFRLLFILGLIRHLNEALWRSSPSLQVLPQGRILRALLSICSGGRGEIPFDSAVPQTLLPILQVLADLSNAEVSFVIGQL